MQSVNLGDKKFVKAIRKLFREAKGHAQLAWDLAYRDIFARYGNSIGGIFWLVITPASFVGIYWLVFAYFLQLKWLNPITGVEVSYLVPLFAGLATYFLLNDVIMSSLSTFRHKREYVRRAAVPIWVLWLSMTMRVAMSAATNFFMLVAMVLIAGLMSWQSLVAIPLSLFLIVIFAISISLLLSLLGPFFKDLDEIARVILRVLFYTSPVSYPLTTVPERFIGYLWVNPLTVLVEAVRNAFVFGCFPSTLSYGVMLVFSLALFWLAIWLYSRLKGPIVDVV
jgi:lipopolysaccharide transport system permease protein